MIRYAIIQLKYTDTEDMRIQIYNKHSHSLFTYIVEEHPTISITLNMVSDYTL